MKSTLFPLAIASALTIPNIAAAKNAPSVDIAGVIEIEASQNSPYTGNSSSDVAVATAELSMSGKVNEKISGLVTLLYEEDDTPVEVDVATLTYSANENVSVTAGQTFVPFGVFDSNMVSDPFTLEIAETRESAIQVDFKSGAITTSLYAFNGTNKQNSGNDDKVDNFGINVGYASDNLSINLGYTNDIGDSDGIQGTLSTNDVQSHVAGIALSAMYETDNFNVIAEYITANDNFTAAELAFNGQGAEPSALNVEVGFGFIMSGMPTNLGVAYQVTDEALALGLAETRLSAALSLELMENTSLAFEYAQDDDYSAADGGTGQSANTITVQLATEF